MIENDRSILPVRKSAKGKATRRQTAEDIGSLGGARDPEPVLRDFVRDSDDFGS